MTKNNYYHEVSVVLVTYNPNKEVLRSAILAVSDQVSDIIIVDNASINFTFGWLNEIENRTNSKLHLLQQDKNSGIGAGHNIGIHHAIKQGAKFVLLLDQDSQVGPDMVAKLKSAYADLNEKGFQVAALGSRYCDSSNGTLSQFTRVGAFGFTLSDCNSENSVVEADFLISSGMLLPITAIESVGLMDESLFIDHVDTEWCFRAKSYGFRLFGVSNAVMLHELGERRKDIWLFRKRIVPFHNPFRYYYIFRNSILLYRRNYMPLKWKLADITKTLKIFVFLIALAPNRFSCIRMMFLGLVDGLKGVKGKKEFR